MDEESGSSDENEEGGMYTRSILLPFIVINSLLLILIMILNFVILTIFLKTRIIRKKISNVILFHQGVTDMFNSLFGIALGLVSLNDLINFTKDEKAFDSSYQLTLFTSAMSSILTYALVTCDKFLTVWKPLCIK